MTPSRQATLKIVGNRPPDAVVAHEVVSQAQNEDALCGLGPDTLDSGTRRLLSVVRRSESRVPSPEPRVHHPVDLDSRSTTLITFPRASRTIARSGISPGSECVAQPKHGS